MDDSLELNVVEGPCQALSNVELSGIVAMCDAGIKNFRKYFRYSCRWYLIVVSNERGIRKRKRSDDEITTN